MTGVERIAAERQRQIDVENWTARHDDLNHQKGELAVAAAMYATPIPLFKKRETAASTIFEDAWPKAWAPHWDKRGRHSRLRELEIAGALIAAEIDRLLRLEDGQKAGHYSRGGATSGK